MCNRDDFEQAYIEEVNGNNGFAWYLAQHRVSPTYYLFESDLLTSTVNAAWWAWRRGQIALGAQLQEETPHVLH